MALVEQSKLESLQQGSKERQMERQKVLQKARQKELEQRWQKGQERQMQEASSEMVESCRLAEACDAVCGEAGQGEGVGATLMGLHWKWCYRCH